MAPRLPQSHSSDEETLCEASATAENLLDGVDYTRTADVKDQIELTGNDVGAVSLPASQLRQSCSITKKDLRKFLDGIFVSWKGPTPEPV